MQAFIDLVNRHEQSFYSFVHKVHSKGQGLFDNLMKWIERFLTAIREGIGASGLGGEGNKVVLETMLPAGSEERARIMEEVDKVIHWHYLNKIAHEEKLRSRFRRVQKGNDAGMDADAEDEATQVLINSVAGEFDFNDLVRANADELAAEESDDDDSDDDDYDDDDDSDDEDTSEYETDSDEAEEDMTPMHKNLQTPSVCPSTIQSLGVETTQVVAELTPPETPQQPVVPRPRSLSLRSIQSMKTLGKLRSTVDAPPVPPLPVHFDRPIPPHPSGPSSASFSRRRSTGHLTSSPEHGPNDDPHSPSTRRPPHKPRKKVVATTQPPELRHIPTLLPIFVEMVCYRCHSQSL